ncbi:MAG: GTPase Der [Phycisphaerae bacterium]|nr:GTPase Der [Phycisphaerae bacterium]
MSSSTPRGMRLHIGFFGRRNVGKSSLINALVGQQVSIVSPEPGTTTDPVEKAMELQPLGPVLLMDTAGVDDVGELGQARVQRTRLMIERTDLAILVADGSQWGEHEEQLLQQFKNLKLAHVVVFNKTDLQPTSQELCTRLREQHCPVIPLSATQLTGIDELRELLIQNAPEAFVNPPSILGDLVPAGELVVLVVPIDLEAPQGRLILPQVQCIRDILDIDAYCMVVKERELRDALERLKRPPALVVTDSQAFLKVTADVPPDIRMTSFSILFARYRGDLLEFVRGAMAIDRLQSGDQVLMAEACTHHPQAEDIGRVKIPRWLRQYVGGHLEFTHTQGHDFPADLQRYCLVVHCGACMQNRRQVLSRVKQCIAAQVPITNYGMAIAYSLGIFDRALAPFPAALEFWNRQRQQK